MMKPSLPENTPKEVAMDIIATCEGNIEMIDGKIQELWENGMEDEWTVVLTRKQKVSCRTWFVFLDG